MASHPLSRILIVDDDASVIQTFARMLRMEGYEVLTAPDAEAAMRELESSRPDAVLLDLQMPLGNGVEFLRRLRAVADQTPVAIITGEYGVGQEMAREIRELKAELYFKPLWPQDLVGIARRLLRGTAEATGTPGK